MGAGLSTVRVLHVVKTSDGALWAASQAAVLRRLGVEVHVAVPNPTGTALSASRSSGAVLHEADLRLPLGRPSLLRSAGRRAWSGSCSAGVCHLRLRVRLRNGCMFGVV